MILATAFKHNWKWLKIAISKLHLKNAKIHLLGFTGKVLVKTPQNDPRGGYFVMF